VDAKSGRLLKETSRTFLIPIMRMPDQLQDAVGSAYLCLRAIDEIEDHPDLDGKTKIRLLQEVAAVFRSNSSAGDSFDKLFAACSEELPEVTLSLAELAELAPAGIRSEIHATTAEMALAMANWVERDWQIETEEDLDQYTFDVAGRVGLLLSEIWKWHDGTACDRDLAVGFGRALQAVNIVRNRDEDLERGADFFPDGWTEEDLIAYARRMISLADRYMEPLPQGPVNDFCLIPLELAKATLDAIEDGREKLSRQDVESLMLALDMC